MIKKFRLCLFISCFKFWGYALEGQLIGHLLYWSLILTACQTWRRYKSCSHRHWVRLHFGWCNVILHQSLNMRFNAAKSEILTWDSMKVDLGKPPTSSNVSEMWPFTLKGEQTGLVVGQIGWSRNHQWSTWRFVVHDEIIDGRMQLARMVLLQSKLNLVGMLEGGLRYTKRSSWRR